MQCAKCSSDNATGKEVLRRLRRAGLRELLPKVRRREPREQEVLRRLRYCS